MLNLRKESHRLLLFILIAQGVGINKEGQPEALTQEQLSKVQGMKSCPPTLQGREVTDFPTTIRATQYILFNQHNDESVTGIPRAALQVQKIDLSKFAPRKSKPTTVKGEIKPYVRRKNVKKATYRGEAKPQPQAKPQPVTPVFTKEEIEEISEQKRLQELIAQAEREEREYEKSVAHLRGKGVKGTRRGNWRR